MKEGWNGGALRRLPATRHPSPATRSVTWNSAEFPAARNAARCHQPPVTRPVTVAARKAAPGMAVLELLVAIGVFGVVLGLTVQLILQALRLSDEVAARAELQEDVAGLVERMARDLGEADHVETFGRRLVVHRPGDSTVEYAFVPEERSLLRDAGKARRCVLKTTLVDDVAFRLSPPFCEVRVAVSRRMPRSVRSARFSLATTVRLRH